MAESGLPIRVRSTRRSLELKQAILACFALEPAAALFRLHGFGQRDWMSVQWWLDTSGMALYFYHRAGEIGAADLLPRELASALAQRLSNNRIRTKSLLDESGLLAAAFEAEGIPYALLKGFTLTPHSVPQSVLRCQADLDYLVAEPFAGAAVHAIQRLGYRLHAQCGHTLEFRAGHSVPPDMLNIYSVKTERALELHLAVDTSCEMRVLSRRVSREFGGASIYALSAPDILVEQARHLLKHLCGEHTRLSWILEFWRHLRSRSAESGFWSHTEASADEATLGNLAMGTAGWLAEEFFGGIQAELPSQWRTGALPVRVRLWLERYARRLLLSDTIGTKLYALLRQELPGAAHQQRTVSQILVPRVLPAAILRARPNESRSETWARYCIELRFVFRRLWFHFREGIRFAVEASRWSRTVARAGQ